MERQEIGIVTGKMKMPAERDFWKLLLLLGGVFFLFEFHEVAKESSDMNTCVSISKKALMVEGLDEPSSHAAAVGQCNGNSVRK
tara:strand:+ start:89 stop:340 length:252 start_codon:yes stop_codon:yes gene_type:complete